MILKKKDYQAQEIEYALKRLETEGYLNHKRVSFFVDGGLYIQKSVDTLTMKGIEFLEENTKWSKLYKGIKEFRNFLPL